MSLKSANWMKNSDHKRIEFEPFSSNLSTYICLYKFILSPFLVRFIQCSQCYIKKSWMVFWKLKRGQGLPGQKCGLTGLIAVSKSPFEIPRHADFKKVQKFRKFDPDIKMTASSILGIFEIGFINPFFDQSF